MNQPPARRQPPPIPVPQPMPQGGYGVPTTASQHIPLLLTVWTYGKAALFALGFVVVLEAVADRTGFSPSLELGGFFGRISAAEMAAREEAEVQYRGQIAEAEANVQRVTMAYQAELQRLNAGYEAQLEWMSGAYAAAYQRLQTVTEAATKMEHEYLRTIAEVQQAGQGGNNFVAGMSDIVCALGVFGNDRQAMRACGMGDALRERNVREVERAVTRNTGNITRQVMSGLPDPQNLAGQLQAVSAAAVPPPTR